MADSRTSFGTRGAGQGTPQHAHALSNRALGATSDLIQYFAWQLHDSSLGPAKRRVKALWRRCAPRRATGPKATLLGKRQTERGVLAFCPRVFRAKPVIRAAAIIPAYQAEASIGLVVSQLRSEWRLRRNDTPALIVVDDGSTDGTRDAARQAGADVVRHACNLGKGAALRSGLERAQQLGMGVAVAVDADGQHPARDAMQVLCHDAPPDALVLGVRNLKRAGAPRANQFSNEFSNLWLSGFCGTRLSDTQCGLRRYPVDATLALGTKAKGYGFEAEIILRAAQARWSIVETPIQVYYPPEAQRTTHFHSVRDPFRIVLRILYTVATKGKP